MKRSLLLLIALGACVSPPKPVAPPAVRAVPIAPPMAPPPVIAWEDRARTLGDWSLIGDTAAFADVTGRKIFSVQCVGADVIVTNEGAPAGPVTIRTTTLARTLQATSGGQARLGAADPLLDAMIFSRGRFMVSMAGRADLIIPPWPELARVVEDCRR